MTDRDRDPRVDFRLPDGLLEWLDGQVEASGLTRSEVLRRSLHFMRETQGDVLEREAELRDEIQDIIEQNQQLRQVVPSKWRNHIRGLFVDDLRDDTSPRDLRAIAAGYRRQAEKMEDLAETIPHAPEGDLVGIVDEELRHALEAADLSNWYVGVDNPHERHLAGVRDGKEEREGLVAVVQGVVETYSALAAAFKSTDETPAVNPSDLPHDVESILPDDVEREDVARFATELVRAGVTADQVPNVVPTVDPSLDVEDIEEIVEADGGEVEPAKIRKGERIIDLEDEQTDADDGQPLAVEASETMQRELVTLPAADGGRNPDSIAPERDGVEEDTEDMNPITDDDESIDTDDHADASDVLDVLAAAGEAEKEARADE